jgi:hypothetical protein
MQLGLRAFLIDPRRVNVAPNRTFDPLPIAAPRYSTVFRLSAFAPHRTGCLRQSGDQFRNACSSTASDPAS